MTGLTATLIEANVAIALAIIAVALSRPIALKLFDAETAYYRWCLVPSVGLAVLLPGPPSEFVTLDMPLVPTGDLLPQWPAAAIETPRRWASGDGASLFVSGLLSWLWALGAATLGGLILSAQHRFRVSLGRTEPASEYGANVHRTDLAIAGPFLIDLLNPRIIIPRDFEERYDPTERRLVLLHEQLHRRRGDLPVNYLAAAITCVCWFNPLVYFGWSMLRRDQELACDAAIARRHPGARKTYGMALLRTARSDRGSPLACTLHKRSVIGERIGQLSRYPTGPWRRVLGTLGMVTLVSAGSAFAWAQQPAGDGPMHIATDDPGMLSARSIIDTFAPGERTAFPNREKIVVQGAVLIDLVPESRDDIMVETNGGVQVEQTLDTLRLVGARDLAQVVCENGAWSPTLPIIRLRTPRRVKFELHGAGYLRAAGVDDLAVTATGCSAVDVRARIGDLSLIGTGTTRHLLGEIGDSAIILRDRASLAALDAGNGAQIQLNDRSRATIRQMGEGSAVTARQRAIADLGPVGERASLRGSDSSRILATSVGRSSSIRLDGRALVVLDSPLAGSEMETRDAARVEAERGAVRAERRRIAAAEPDMR